jgi:hypothetical protein
MYASIIFSPPSFDPINWVTDDQFPLDFSFYFSFSIYSSYPAGFDLNMNIRVLAPSTKNYSNAVSVNPLFW